MLEIKVLYKLLKMCLFSPAVDSCDSELNSFNMEEAKNSSNAVW